LQLGFSEKLGATLDPTDVSVTPIGGGPAISPTSVSFSLSSKVASFSFGAALTSGVWRATLPAGSVADGDSNPIAAPFTSDFVLVRTSSTFALPAGTKKVNQLTIGGGGKLDVGTSTLVIDYTSTSVLPTIAAQVASGRNGGSWDGFPIVSSAAASAGGLTTL